MRVTPDLACSFTVRSCDPSCMASLGCSLCCLTCSRILALSFLYFSTLLSDVLLHCSSIAFFSRCSSFYLFRSTPSRCFSFALGFLSDSLLPESSLLVGLASVSLPFLPVFPVLCTSLLWSTMTNCLSLSSAIYSSVMPSLNCASLDNFSRFWFDLSCQSPRWNATCSSLLASSRFCMCWVSCPYR